MVSERNGVEKVLVIVKPGGLKRSVRKALKEGAYSEDEVYLIYHEILDSYRSQCKGFRMACLVVLGVFVILVALSFQKMMDNRLLLGFFAGTILVVFILLAFVKGLYIDRSKRQFLNAVKKGYPQLNNFLF